MKYFLHMFLMTKTCRRTECVSVFVGVCLGTEKARAVAQNILDIPYGEGDEEKLDVYMPDSSSPGKAMQRRHSGVLASNL